MSIVSFLNIIFLVVSSVLWLKHKIEIHFFPFHTCCNPSQGVIFAEHSQEFSVNRMLVQAA